MRSLTDASSRWQETLKHSSSLAELQRAVKNNGPDSPCISGCRSVCWKAFLLSQTPHATSWTRALLESRSSYASRREHFLKYIKHPEYLTAGNSDPLADDSNSPWNTYRLDEILRAEILQDVQRLPDEPFYHQPHVQTLITNVLFIYCKLNPDVGGYRQGMHELLAPIVYVVEQDAINPVDASTEALTDLRMVEMLDASFIEHDSFALFSRVMDSAKEFYETGEPLDNTGNAAFSNQPTKYSIVEKSQYIHEICLYKIDPELSIHLKNIEILPQVFLIRWIRLLFSREFPFNQMLILWDTLFSIDPTFKLIDLICTSMLIRIRWELLEADYTAALQLLLRYPVPRAPYGPHTFLDDAVYLRDHLDTTGGTDLTKKYTGRAPSPPSSSRPTTPKATAPSLRRKLAGARSPLSPTRFRPPAGGVEALFQGAAKNVLEQGEKLGINQAVRDAMVEIRRNVHEAKTSMKTGRDLFSESRSSSTTAIGAVASLDRRNRRLASMLDEPIATLRSLSGASGLEGDKKKEAQDALDVAAAKLQLIKVYLEDATLALPDEDDAPVPRPEERTVDSEPLSNAVAAMALNTTMVTDTPTAESESETTKPASAPHPKDTSTDTDPLGVESSSTVQTIPLQRPQPPIPTRSTLAQSSFSWMLEPDSSSTPTSTTTTTSTSTSISMFGPAKSDTALHRQRTSGHASRERTAFLFGEVSPDTAVRQEDIFGLEPIRKARGSGEKRDEDGEGME
ncbi:rab-GTPase-TBC domain-containing protein [Xylaria intraflava]|nr:rab-GTPase-TBC domain-containing protein [Xylaria intraflava]